MKRKLCTARTTRSTQEAVLVECRLDAGKRLLLIYYIITLLINYNFYIIE